MNDRDRLIELISNAPFGEYQFSHYIPSGLHERIADYLLANGVIVQPKTVFAWYDVGEYIYYHNKCYGIRSAIPILRKRNSLITKLNSSYRGIDEITKIEIREIPYKPHHRSYLGKTVFLTKEEAEAELRKRSDNNA